MRISGYRQAYDAFSSKASEISRQLSLAGLALVWIFKKEGVAQPSVPEELLLPSVLFVGSLALDLLHATYGAAAWGIFSRIQEKRKKGRDAHVSAPAWINWPSNLFFWGKIVAVAVGYGFALVYLYSLYRPV